MQIQDWMHPNLHPFLSDAHQQMLKSTDTEICAEGPTRTSKTIVNLTKQIGLHFQNYGMKSCIVRSDAVDLTSTVRKDLTQTILKYGLDDPRSPIRQSGGLERFDTLYINGGFIKLGGMSRPGSILGTQYDLATISQLEQLTLEQYTILKTRVSGSATAWKFPDGRPRFQIQSDSNPDIPDHWMYEREEAGRLRFVKFGFKDNPHFFRDGKWSHYGIAYVGELGREPEGPYKDRYFYGKRISPEGAVFHIEPCHIIDEDEWKTIDLEEYYLYCAMDFGTSAPNVIIWILEHKETQDTIVAQEWRQTGPDVDRISEAYELFAMPLNVIDTVIDNDERMQTVLAKAGIQSSLADKGQGSVNVGIALLNSALDKTRKGLPGGLRIFQGLRCNSDPELIRQKKSLSILDELKWLCYSQTKDEVTGERHAIDALRYHYLKRQTGMIVPDLPPILGRVNLHKKRDATII